MDVEPKKLDEKQKAYNEKTIDDELNYIEDYLNKIESMFNHTDAEETTFLYPSKEELDNIFQNAFEIFKIY